MNYVNVKINDHPDNESCLINLLIKNGSIYLSAHLSYTEGLSLLKELKKCLKELTAKINEDVQELSDGKEEFNNEPTEESLPKGYKLIDGELHLDLKIDPLISDSTAKNV